MTHSHNVKWTCTTSLYALSSHYTDSVTLPSENSSFASQSSDDALFTIQVFFV